MSEPSTAAMTTETAANCAQARTVAVTSDVPTPSRPIRETPSPSANKTPSETTKATPNEGACDITLTIRRHAANPSSPPGAPSAHRTSLAPLAPAETRAIAEH